MQKELLTAWLRGSHLIWFLCALVNLDMKLDRKQRKAEASWCCSWRRFKKSFCHNSSWEAVSVKGTQEHSSFLTRSKAKHKAWQRVQILKKCVHTVEETPLFIGSGYLESGKPPPKSHLKADILAIRSALLEMRWGHMLEVIRSTVCSIHLRERNGEHPSCKQLCCSTDGLWKWADGSYWVRGSCSTQGTLDEVKWISFYTTTSLDIQSFLALAEIRLLEVWVYRVRGFLEALWAHERKAALLRMGGGLDNGMILKQTNQATNTAYPQSSLHTKTSSGATSRSIPNI